MKKRWIAILLSLCCLCASLAACTDEEILPPEQPDQSGQESEDKQDFPERVENDIPIDATRYDENDYAVTIMGQNEFLNAHGMVFIQDGGLCYVNKASKVTSSFCMDALCEHEMGWCPALFFGGMGELAKSMRIYSPADGKLYGSRADALTFGSNDGNLYSMTVDTMESKRVFNGNGNELRFFQVQGDYVYVTRNRKDGGFEHIRYNVKTEKAEILTPPEGKIFSNLWVGNHYMIVKFWDEYRPYLVNEGFDTFEPLEGVDSFAFVHGEYLYGADFNEDDTKSHYTYHIPTKEKHYFTSNVKDCGVFQTIGGGYLYLLSQDSTCLYRILVTGENNQPELVYKTNTGSDIRGMKIFDKEIYISLNAPGDGEYSVVRYGNLVQSENGWEFVDFKQGNVLG